MKVMDELSEGTGKLGKARSLKLYEVLDQKVEADSRKMGVSWSEAIRRVLEDHYGIETGREHKTVSAVEKLSEEVNELRDQLKRMGGGKKPRRG